MILRRAAFLSLIAWVGALLGCSHATVVKDYSPTWARFYLETADARSSPVVLPHSGVRVAVGVQPVLSENDLANVELVRVELGQCLMFKVTPSATRDLYRLTAANQGRRLVLTVNGEPLGARRIDGPLTDGVVFVFAEVEDADLPRLVQNLKRSTLALQAELAKK
jgi:hypothetical protein